VTTLLLLGWALAQEGESLDPEETARVNEAAPEESVVVDWFGRVGHARMEVERTLQDMGWDQRRRRRGDWVIYTHPSPWKPKVMIHDDGFMIIRRRGVHIARPQMADLGGWEVPLEIGLCFVAPLACVHFEGLFVAGPILERQKQILVDGASPSVRTLSDSLANREVQQRLEELPITLDRIWIFGENPWTGKSLPDHAARRALLLEQWLWPADNEQGNQVRFAVEDYLRYMVQDSEHPCTAEEIAATNARRQSENPLDLGNE
jgi:predicted RNA binding protein YcfA (HicA-like mRNA interferase family)